MSYGPGTLNHFGLARQHALSKARRQCNLALDFLHQMMYP
jgi:hypothetical protein